MNYLIRMLAFACIMTGSIVLVRPSEGEAQVERGPLPQEPVVRDSTDILFTVAGLSGPEAVRYDPDQDVYFVANFGDREGDIRDANGFISRVSAADGSVESPRFMIGTESSPLHMPRGMFIRGDTLWVADVDGVHGFLRGNGRHAAFVDFTALEPGFLNDIAAGPDGLLYVTDTGRGRVYRVRADAVPEVAIESDRTGPPNGITWDPARNAFLLAPWGGGTILRAWEPATGEITDVATLVGGHFDGIELVGGEVLIASQDDDTLYLVEDGAVRPLIRVPGDPADIGVDTRRGRVAVPYIARGRVDVWELPSTPPASGQIPEEVSAALDAVYERFTRAYSLADPDSVLVLYADHPLYLPGQGPVLVGKDALRTQFGFLDAIRGRSASARISFRSVQRGASGEMAWDVGYYTLAVQEQDGRQSPPSRGKFATVWHWEEGPGWRILVDSFSPAP